MEELEQSFIDYIDYQIQQLEHIKKNPLKELESHCFQLYCISDNIQVHTCRLGNRYDNIINKVRNINNE
jgi:hypothetical protein